LWLLTGIGRLPTPRWSEAEYGAKIIKKLSKELTEQYGKGYTKANLYSFYAFYRAYPEIFQTVSGKSAISLLWSHFAAVSDIVDFFNC
jgi:hypothetical protein